MTFGLGGYGMLIAPVEHCRALVNADNELVIAHDATEIARFVPGDHSATAPPTWDTPKHAQFGAGGPKLLLEDHVVYAEVAKQIDVGLGESPWCVLGPGIVHDLPAGVIVVPAAPGDEDPMYELHLYAGNQELIRLQRHDRPAASVTFRPAPYQQLVDQSAMTVTETDGSIRKLLYLEVAYEHEGQPWKQLLIAAPLHPTTSVIVTAQARSENAHTLFRIASQVAATMGPLG